MKRSGIVILACYGTLHKQADNTIFESFLEKVVVHSDDDRQYVKKAISWAIRNIGKRNRDLQQSAIATAQRLLAAATERSATGLSEHSLAGTADRTAIWIANDCLRELQQPQLRLRDYPRSIYRSHR